jgi:hypothetical protein
MFILSTTNGTAMTFRSIFALIILFSVLAGGCKKKNIPNPCEGLLNEAPPRKIMLKLVEKATGNNLVLTKDLKASDFTITNAETNKPFINWRIVSNTSGASPLNGVLELSVFHETAAQHHYQIKVEHIGTATLAYTVSKTATNDQCKPFSYPISELKITDHPFTPFTYEGKSYPNILVLEL